MTDFSTPSLSIALAVTNAAGLAEPTGAIAGYLLLRPHLSAAVR